MRNALGEYGDPNNQDGSLVRIARANYFWIIYWHRRDVYNDLIDFYNAPENCNLMSEYVAHNGYYDQFIEAAILLNPVVVRGREYKSPLKTRPEDVKRADEWLKSWSSRHLWQGKAKLQDLEPWIFDLVVSIWNQWAWQPRIPHTDTVAGEQPPGYWWSLGAPAYYFTKDLSFTLISEATWYQQKLEHYERTGEKPDFRKKAAEITTVNLLIETSANAKRRIKKMFNQRLNSFIAELEKESEELGYVKMYAAKNKFRTAAEHYHWLYYRHMEEKSTVEIAEMFGPLKRDETLKKLNLSNAFGAKKGKSLTKQAVSEKTLELAETIGISF